MTVDTLEPVEAALDEVASAVGLPVEPWRSPATACAPQPVPPLVGLFGNGVRDAASPQVGAETAGAVSLVRDDLVGSAAWPAEAAAGNADAFEQDACADTVVALAPGVTRRARRRPLPSLARWTFVVSPPRDRPRA